MLNLTNSVHRLLSGRIKENSEYTLDANNLIVKYADAIQHQHEGVLSTIPPSYPHMLPLLDGHCYSTLPETLANNNLAAYADGIICFLMQGPHKKRLKATQ